MSDQNPRAGEKEIAHGDEFKTTAEADLQHTKKVAPLPEGMDEMKDGVYSGGGSRGNEEGSGKGGNEPRWLQKEQEEKK